MLHVSNLLTCACFAALSALPVKCYNAFTKSQLFSEPNDPEVACSKFLIRTPRNNRTSVKFADWEMIYQSQKVCLGFVKYPLVCILDGNKVQYGLKI